MALAAIAGLLAAVASATGVFRHGDLATAAVTTFRGETLGMPVNGAYRYNFCRNLDARADAKRGLEARTV